MALCLLTKCCWVVDWLAVNWQAPEGDSEEERKLKQLVSALNDGRPVPPDLSIAGLKRRRRRTGSVSE